MKILVVEDDGETASYLVKGLRESGYTVDCAGDGRDGLYLASSGGYEAIILDRMLPGMDGLAMLDALRAAEIRTPALILSALGRVDDRVRQKIDKSFEHPLLHTVRGAGYCLRPPE